MTIQTICSSYLADTTTAQDRTSRMSLLTAARLLGAPLGTLAGRYIDDAFGYAGVFTASGIVAVLGIVYLVFLVPETRGLESNQQLEEGSPLVIVESRQLSIFQRYGAA